MKITFNHPPTPRNHYRGNRMNFISGPKTLPPKIAASCQSIADETGFPTLVMIINKESIERSTYEAICANCDKIGKGTNLNLILRSYGGDLHSAYRIMKELKKRYSHITSYIPHYAKSAATFMAITCNEVVLARQGELGPLDSQHENPQDPQKTVSALDSFKALEAIRKFAFETLDEAMITVTVKSGFSIVEAFPHVIKFVGTIVDPLFSNLDVQRLGDYGKSLEVAKDYCLRLMPDVGYIDEIALHRLINKLIWNYPSHGQVIDYDESQALGLTTREASEDEQKALDPSATSGGSFDFVGIINPSKKAEETNGTKDGV